MAQVTSSITSFESDIQRMRQYLAQNREARPLHEVEEDLFALALSIGRSALQAYVDQVGTGYVGTQHRDEMGTVRTFHSFQSRTYRSIFGAIEIKRAYYFRSGVGGVRPLDAALSLPERSYSLVLQQWVALLGVKSPFDDGLDDLARLLGVQVPKRMAEAIVKEAARDVATFREGLPAPENEGKILVIQADGKGIPMVRPKVDETPGPKMRRKKGEKKNKQKMATVFTFYTMNPKKDMAPEALN
ncbi:MAG: hypothetical protein Q8P12_08225, partial [bacterium]|nr:hypothetical protein [bacterium]